MEHLLVVITSARGPEECTWVVPRVLAACQKDLEEFELDYQVIERNPGNFPNTLRSVVIKVSGKKAKSALHAWNGVVQWIGQSPFRKLHRRKNWFIETHVISCVDSELDYEGNIKYQTYRASGPGGQHVNKTESAVRAIHVPTGVFAECQEHRSQGQNKREALRKLMLRLELFAWEKAKEQLNEQWKMHTSVQRGNPVRVYEGIKFERIK